MSILRLKNKTGAESFQSWACSKLNLNYGD